MLKTDSEYSQLSSKLSDVFLFQLYSVVTEATRHGFSLACIEPDVREPIY